MPRRAFVSAAGVIVAGGPPRSEAQSTTTYRAKAASAGSQAARRTAIRIVAEVELRVILWHLQGGLYGEVPEEAAHHLRNGDGLRMQDGQRHRQTSRRTFDGLLFCLCMLIGMAVGSDLPVMAIQLTIVAWTLIWFGACTNGVEVSLKADGEPDALEVLRLFKEAMPGPGRKVAHQIQVAGEAGTAMVQQVSGGLAEPGTETLLTGAVPAGTECKIRL